MPGIGQRLQEPLLTDHEGGADASLGQDRCRRERRGDDLFRLGLHPDGGEPLDDLRRRSARVVGDERDPLARLPQGGNRLGGTGDRLGPSVQDAVQIEQDRVVGVGEHACQAESRSSTLT